MIGIISDGLEDEAISEMGELEAEKSTNRLSALGSHSGSSELKNEWWVKIVVIVVGPEGISSDGGSGGSGKT